MIKREPAYVPCPNCGTYRKIDEHWIIEKCPDCGDEEFEEPGNTPEKAPENCNGPDTYPITEIGDIGDK